MTLLMGIAFYSIYTRPVTRVSASKWIDENVPAGAVIGHESWDDEVPSGVAGVAAPKYGSVTFSNFDNDSPQHVQQLLSNIDEVDYIALSSARVSGTVPRVPAVWPVTSKYYETLANGGLGKRAVAAALKADAAEIRRRVVLHLLLHHRVHLRAHQHRMGSARVGARRHGGNVRAFEDEEAG